MQHKWICPCGHTVVWNSGPIDPADAILCGDCSITYDQKEGIFATTAINADRDQLLVEREKTHGSFEKTASISQELKAIFHRHGVARGLEHPFSVQVEALDMIAVKLARILSGNPHVKDHWDDIAGYAKLGAEACDVNHK